MRSEPSLCSSEGEISYDDFLWRVTDLKRAPKWLKSPVGVSFGFGGKLVTFGPKKAAPGAAGPSLSEVESLPNVPVMNGEMRGRNATSCAVGIQVLVVIMLIPLPL